MAGGRRRAPRGRGSQERASQARAARGPGRRTELVVGVVGVLVLVAGGATALVLSRSQSPQPSAETPARVYKDVDACLLTGPQGITSGQGAQAWAALESFSAKTSVRVSYLPVVGEASAANAQGFLAGLVQRNCRAVVTVGASQAQAARALAPKVPAVTFVVVDQVGPAAAGNVVAVAPDSGVQDRLVSALERAVIA